MVTKSVGVWCCSSSTSVKVLFFMVQLIAVSRFVSVLGPLSSNWFFLSSYPWLWNSGLPSSTGAMTSTKILVSSIKDSKNHLDLAVVDVHNMEEAISNESVLNHSSTPFIDGPAQGPR